jgi:hypothetical protein
LPPRDHDAGVPAGGASSAGRVDRDFVPEESEAAGRSRADRALGGDTALAALVPRWCLLDHEPALRHTHLERRVVEVTAISPLDLRGDRLEDLPVEPYRMP